MSSKLQKELRKNNYDFSSGFHVDGFNCVYYLVRGRNGDS